MTNAKGTCSDGTVSKTLNMTEMFILKFYVTRIKASLIKDSFYDGFYLVWPSLNSIIILIFMLLTF